MGKGFQNFMSKKDFHPSAWWNLKKVWEAKEKKKMDEQKQEELKTQYEKEQEMMNNKALLGDEKAKLGLSFMYDAPTGMTKREEPKEEPKFEWQRKYNAPREEWAKGNDAIQDQPFGIQVRNVRCVKCHTWGHLNTDRECPLFNMSGNADNPGIVTNPSDVLREMREKKVVKEENIKKDDPSDDEPDYEAEPKAKPIPQVQLLSDMKEDHGFKFKKNILQNLRSEEVLTNLGTKKPTEGNLEDFLGHLNDKQRKNIVAKVFGKKSKEYLAEKSKQKSSKSAGKEAKKSKASEDEKSTRRSRKDDRHPKQKRHSDETERKKERKRRSSSESSNDSGIERKRRRHDRVGDEICRQKARSRREDSSSEDERRHRSHGSKQSRRSRSPNYRKHR